MRQEVAWTGRRRGGSRAWSPWDRSARDSSFVRSWFRGDVCECGLSLSSHWHITHPFNVGTLSSALGCSGPCFLHCFVFLSLGPS